MTLTSKSIQRTGRVEMRRHARTHVHELTNALDAGGLVEVTSADCLSHDVVFRSRGHEGHLLEVHDVLELLPDLASFAEQLGVQEVSHSPIVAESVQ
jgi:hypothetical protein